MAGDFSGSTGGEAVVNRTLVTALSVLLLGASAPAVPAAAAAPSAEPPGTPCAAGTPVRSDFDGDGLADLVVGGSWWDGTATVREQSVQPAAGTPLWLHETGDLRPADLNGDVCADAIVFAGGYEPWVSLLPGTPAGLDQGAAVTLPFPQAADADEADDRSLTFDAVGLRHDGISQVVLAGRHVWENDNYGAFVDVLTLDPTLAVSAPRCSRTPASRAAPPGSGRWPPPGGASRSACRTRPCTARTAPARSTSSAPTPTTRPPWSAAWC
jgi:hypothetical protein